MSLELSRLVAGMGRPRIAVVGDAIVDEYVWGEVERISPEAPIPVLKVVRRETRAGGAGSVVSNLARLGAEVSFYGVRGDDGAGAKLVAILGGAGADLDGLLVEDDRPTTKKARHIGFVQHADRAVQQLLRVDEEISRPIRAKTLDGLLSRFRKHSGDFDAVLVSDYQKGLLSEGLLDSLRRMAPRAPFLVDPALQEDYSSYRGSFLLCPNRYEASLASRMDCSDLSGCARAAEKLALELGLGAVALTMDKDGIYLHERGAASRHFPTKARVVADVTGAGDMVLSVLGLVLAAGGALSQAVELANVAAGVEVRRLGATPVSREELLHELRYHGHPGVEKIKKLEELGPLVRSAREAGKTVVFTNGCFDLLHVGHHHLLHGASEMGDLLVVAVNSDASVRRLKGPTRPRISQEERMLMLSGLEVVDFVVCFEEDTPIPLLEALRPDVLVKGEEYKNGVVVGREVVEGYGGQVTFVAHIPGISTSTILGEKMG